MSAFTCEHGSSYALFGEGDPKALAPVIDQLLADIETLQTRLRAMSVPPATRVG